MLSEANHIKSTNNLGCVYMKPKDSKIETEYRQSGQVVVSEWARIRNGKLVCGRCTVSVWGWNCHGNGHDGYTTLWKHYTPLM